MPKKSVDANKPRGPITAYALFVRTCRGELRRKYPQLTVDYNVIAKKCSERWKGMNENEKRRFNDTADVQRRRYKEELATYQQEQSAKQLQQQSITPSILLQTPSTQYLVDPAQQQQHTLIIPTPTQNTLVNIPKKTPKKRERKPKDPLAPKKPLSAYFLFCADERPKVHGTQTGMSVSDVARELGVRWKSTPVELKTKYEQAASEKKHVYQAEMALYKHQTSINSSPPETPQTPFTPHDFQSTFSSIPIQRSLQFDTNNPNENHEEFDMMTNENDDQLE